MLQTWTLFVRQHNNFSFQKSKGAPVKGKSPSNTFLNAFSFHEYLLSNLFCRISAILPIVANWIFVLKGYKEETLDKGGGGQKVKRCNIYLEADLTALGDWSTVKGKGGKSFIKNDLLGFCISNMVEA